MYVIYLAAATEGSSLHAIMKCVTNSSTLLNGPSPYNCVCGETLIRQGRIRLENEVHLGGGADWRHEVAPSSEDYGKFILMP